MNAARENFPWQRMMELGLGVLRLPPQEFWAATPREISAAFGGPRAEMGRGRFAELMERYPD